MDKVVFFEVTQDTDKDEGRGRRISTGIAFKKRKDAITFVESQEYADRFGIMGTPGYDSDVREVEFLIFDSIMDFGVNFRKEEEKRKKKEELKKKEDEKEREIEQKKRMKDEGERRSEERVLEEKKKKKKEKALKKLTLSERKSLGL